jgi:hypothetical protein
MKAITEKDNSFAKAADDALKIASEVSHGLISQILKDRLFNRVVNP